MTDTESSASDFYEMLQVSVKAESDVIEAAYHRLMEKWLMNRKRGDAAAFELILKLDEAFDVLSNSAKRAEYDAQRIKRVLTRERQRDPLQSDSSSSQTPPPVTPKAVPVFTLVSDFEWYVLSQGKVSGPFSKAILARMALNGTIWPNDKVRQNYCTWTNAKSFEFLIFQTQESPAKRTPEQFDCNATQTTVATNSASEENLNSPANVQRRTATIFFVLGGFLFLFDHGRDLVGMPQVFFVTCFVWGLVFGLPATFLWRRKMHTGLIVIALLFCLAAALDIAASAIKNKPTAGKFRISPTNNDLTPAPNRTNHNEPVKYESATFKNLDAAMSSTASTSLNYGLALYQKGDYVNAKLQFDDAIKFSPNSSDNYKWRGDTWTRLDNHSMALADYNEAIRLNSHNCAAYLNRGRVHFLDRDLARAIEDFSETIRLCPQDDDGYHARGMAYYMRDDFNKALVDFEQAILFNNRNSDYYQWRGDTNVGLNRLQRAIECYDQAIKIDPNNAFAFNQRGSAWILLDNPSKALADYDMSIFISSRNPHAFLNRGIIYLTTGKYSFALSDFNEAIKLKSDSAIFFYFRGQAWTKLKIYEKALSDYGSARRLDPNNKLYRDAWESAFDAEK